MGTIAADDEDMLEDGTRPSTPDGDNLVLDHARAEAAAFGTMIGAAGGRLLDDDATGLHLRDLGVATPFGNPALLTRPVPDGETARVAAAVADFYAAGPGGPYLVFSPWPTGDWSPHGFIRVGHPPLMFRPPGPVPAPPEGLEVVAVDDAADLARFEETLVEAYPVPEMQPWRAGTLLAPAILDMPWRLLLGLLDGEPAATAGAFVTDRLTLVELVSTRQACRGRGVGAALTAAATAVVPRASPRIVETSPMRSGDVRDTKEVRP